MAVPNTSDESARPPVPDPTILTTQAQERALRAERDYIDGQLDVLRQRLDGIDRATSLLNAQMTQVPTDVDKQVGHLKELTAVELQSIALQFKERDTRSERESKDNKVAVDASFAAQKEAASEQLKSLMLAIDKSEKATAETLNKQAELFRTTTDAIRQQIEDNRGRIGEISQAVNGFARQRAGSTEQRIEHRSQIGANWGALAGVAAAAVVVLGIVGLIITIISTNGPSP